MTSPRRLVPVLVLVAVAATALALSAGSGGGDDSVPARVDGLARQLRCPTCEGLSVSDSPSSTARAIRDDLRRRVAEGEDDTQIKQAYVDRYGDWILLRPRSSGIAGVVWIVPVAALLAGITGLGFAFRRWRREPRLEASAEDAELVERERTLRPPGTGGERS